MENSSRRVGLYHSQYEHDGCGVGFIANIRGEASNRILRSGQTMLERMPHRTAFSSDNNSGDGSGVMTAIPHQLFCTVFKDECNITLPNAGEYAVANVFLPQNAVQAKQCQALIAEETTAHHLTFLGARSLACDVNFVGEIAHQSAPRIVQIVIGNKAYSAHDFERILFVLRKRIAALVHAQSREYSQEFYFCSLSPHLIVYKGMLTPHQLFRYYPDLNNPNYLTHFAMIHSRFSTNTFPSWSRAQPMRHMSHNGEINTLRGNINKMRAREGAIRTEKNAALAKVGLTMADMLPIIDDNTSDSGSFDNVLEFLLQSDYDMPSALMMMVPQAWEKNPHLSADIRAAYQYFSNKMEPWDGPATISFCDGRYIGALLDRNGLRPSRYYVTNDNTVIMASEVGVIDVETHTVVEKGRLHPGKMFLIDFQQGSIINDALLKERIAQHKPYRQWIDNEQIMLSKHADTSTASHDSGMPTTPQILRQFGYTTEHIELLIKPMTQTGKEPLGSMGNDIPLAALSARPKLMYDYFFQMFAQVTNPPIDSIREKLIMSMHSTIGPEQSICQQSATDCRRIHLASPILFPAEYAALCSLDSEYVQYCTIDICYHAQDSADTTIAPAGQEKMVERQDGADTTSASTSNPSHTQKSRLQLFLLQLCQRVEDAVDAGNFFVVLSDRAANCDTIAVSPLLAVGAVHQHLVRMAKRTRVALIIDSAEPRHVHHFCTLLSYGADAIHPYLAYSIIESLHKNEEAFSSYSTTQLRTNYRNALHYGMRKVFGKMGISTLEGYKGAQIFEIVGVAEEVVSLCFCGSASRLGGVSFALLEKEIQLRHQHAFPHISTVYDDQLENPGEYQWRKDGEVHQWHPEAISHLQRAVYNNDPHYYKLFSESQLPARTHAITLRGLLTYNKNTTTAIPLENVEPASEIMRRFATGAMSFGSISKEAHETLALAMNRIGAKSNTGEGGEDRQRFIPLPNGDSLRSAIKQIASGRFGVGIEYLTQADELQIKIAQGAKPGEGGELPGHKVLEVIARTRNSTPGVGLISPPPHHDIYSIEDLAQLIFDLKNANPDARVSVKLVSEVGVGTVAAGVAKAGANHILISGSDGGTGASPLTGIKHAGLPWELGISESHQTLLLNNLRDRVVLQTDGQLKTGVDVVIAAMLGAEEYGFSTAPLIAMGCIMMRVCHLNTCPVGIATQNEQLRKKFKGRAAHVIQYFRFIAEEVRHIMAALGIPSLDQLIGRSDLLQMDHTRTNWKSQSLNMDAIINCNHSLAYHNPRAHLKNSVHTELAAVLDRTIISEVMPLLANGKNIDRTYQISNTDRTACTMLSSHIVKNYGVDWLVEDRVMLRFYGSAGQSFAAWLTRGITVRLEGDANDYVGKGLSGGKIIVLPPPDAPGIPEQQMIVGNVVLYGALAGQCFFHGVAAERFCVRNSGAHVVVEGVGDHGCEYMTGGRVVIIGDIGRNFAAGMSGGIAYIWDQHQHAREHINTEIVAIEELEEEDERIILELLRDHHRYTHSARAEYILDNFTECCEQFFRVIAPSYRQVIELQQERQREVSLE